MTTRRQLILRSLAAVVAALVLIILTAPLWFNLDRYRPQIITYFEQTTGKKVEIERVTLTLLPQPAIHFVSFAVKSPPLFPPSYILRVPRADAILDFWALLHRNVVIRSVSLDQPQINLISDPDGPWNFENPSSQNSKNLFPLGIIDKVTINRGQLIASNLLPSDAQGPVFFEAFDISSELDRVDLAAIVNPTAVALNGLGTWKAARLRFASVETTNVDARFRLESREVFFTNLKADICGGKATGDFSISLAKSTATFKADARVKGLDIAKLLADFHDLRGLLTGHLDGDFKLAGAIEHTANPLAHLHGAGHVKLTNGEVPSLKLNANLMKLARFNDLGPAKENPASFNLIATDLELENLRVTSKAIDIDGYGVDVDGSGSFSVSGSDELSYQGVAAITTKQGFFTNTFARIEGAKLVDGKIQFPFRIDGTLENPKFSKGAKTP
ncbi:MAG TPA: AsmA family protein [Candidatus Acidoferrum sp.]|nr:AsmA family protein [Candidatus Acidoferrum sp.]